MEHNEMKYNVKEYYLVGGEVKEPMVNLTDVAGRIELFDTPYGKLYQEVFKSDIASKLKIVPNITCERDENGNIENLEIISFSIVMPND